MQRILVVEDDPHFGRQLVDLFGFHGYDVTLSERGGEALDRFQKGGADLIVTDLMLPQMSGVDFVKKLRSAPDGRDVPVIMMSAIYKNPKMFEQELRTLNVKEFLAKPFSLIDLGRKVDAILDERVSAELPDAAVTKTGSWRVADLEGALGEGELSFPELGRFDRVQLLSMFIELFKCHVAGRLTLRQGKNERRIYLLNGYPVWARSEDEAERLGEVLIKLRLIDREQLEATLAKAEREGTLFRDALLRSGLIDEARLFRAERERVRRIVVQTFEWAGGEYEFSRRDDFVDRVGIFAVNPVDCLGEAVRRFLNVNELAAEIEPRTSQVLVEGPRYRRLVGYLKLPVEVGSLLECMKGDTTIGELFQRFGMAHESLIKHLWLMFSLGIAETLDAPSAAGGTDTHRESGYVPTVADIDLDDDDEGDELSEFARSVIGDYVRLMGATYYDILGVARDAPPMDVDRAWLRARERFDVRRFDDEDPSEVRDKAKALMNRAETAWRTLRSSETKEAYDLRLRALDSGDFRKP